MSGLLPSESDDSLEDTAPTGDEHGDSGESDLRVLWLDDDEAETLIGSLSSDTARSVLSRLHEGPATASELAEDVNTSLQNVRHHLDNLREAGLVHVSDTRYSVKGREMDVYAPVEDSLMVCVGPEEDRSSFLDSLRRIVGTVLVLGLASALVEWAFGSAVIGLDGPGTVPRVGDSVGGAVEPLLGLLPPGAAFFAGGILVLTLAAAWEYYRRRRRLPAGITGPSPERR